MKNFRFQLGDPINWKISNMKFEGIFIEEVDKEFSLVQTLTKDDMPCRVQLKVITKLLTK